MRQIRRRMGVLIVAAMVVGAALFGSADVRAEGGFAVKGTIASVNRKASQVVVNEKYLQLTDQTEVLDLQGNPMPKEKLNIGDRVYVVGEDVGTQHQVLQISEMQKETSKKGMNE